MAVSADAGWATAKTATILEAEVAAAAAAVRVAAVSEVGPQKSHTTF